MVSGSAAASSRTEASTSKDVFHRLVRTISGRSVTNGAGPARPLPPAEGVPQHQPSETTQSETSTSSHVPNTRKLGVGDKLWKLSQDLPLKLRRNSKSGLASPRVTTGELSTTTDPGRAPAFGQVGHARILSTVAEQADANRALPPSTSTDTLSPATLAQRLRDLIDPLPFPTFSSPIKPPKLAPRDDNGRPITPPSASPVKDNRLIALLSSATFMNGSNADKHRPSIWDLLETLGAPPHGFPETQSTGEDTDDGDGSSGHEPRYAGTSSVMVYSPLIPGKEDIVELGELIPITVEEEIIQDTVAPTSWTSIWPLSLITSWTQFDTQVGVMGDSLRGGFSGDFYVHSDITSMDASGRRVRVKTTSAWVPSTTKMSFQVMWWGYRLWLPPPVMDILSDQTLEAAKRASLIATALAWFFNNLPIDMFPLQVRPALLLMQRIVPYLGYIATFISWSWGTVKSYDVGHGVTLTATWLLPIALIPGTWFEQDVPKSPTQSPPKDIPNNPTPTIPTTPPTIPSQPPSETPKNPPTTSPPSTAPSQPAPNPPTQLPPSTLPVPQPSQPAPVTPSPPQPPVAAPAVPIPPIQQPTMPVSGPSNPAVPAPNGPVISGQIPFSSPKFFAKKLFSLSASKVTSIPVPPPPAGLPPVPPVPTPRTPVHVGSPLGEVLLQAPAMRPVPLPDEPAGSAERPNTRDKERKRRVKTFLGHTGK